MSAHTGGAPEHRDEPPGPGPSLWGDLIEALRFFSRLPTGSRPWQKPDLDRIARVLPIASLVIAAGPALALLAATWLGLPSHYAAALGVALMIVVTGAMADDALADAADGLFGGATPERRLEIMKDSRHGTYGVSALVLSIAFRVIALGEIAATNPVSAAALWVAIAVLSRTASLWLPVALPAARKDGASAAAGRVSRSAFAIGTGIAAVIFAVAVSSIVGPIAATVGLIIAIAIARFWQWTCNRLVSGQTGDLIGALQALIEIALWTGLIAFI